MTEIKIVQKKGDSIFQICAVTLKWMISKNLLNQLHKKILFFNAKDYNLSISNYKTLENNYKFNKI